MAPTLPGAGAPRTDEPPSSRVRRVEWCVDFEKHLGTMTTLELWLAIASGRVVRGQRVWREGMECWVPAELVAELRCAFRDELAASDDFDDSIEEHLPTHDTEPTPPPEAVASSMTPHDPPSAVRAVPRPTDGAATERSANAGAGAVAAPDAPGGTFHQAKPRVARARRHGRARALAVGAALAAVLVLGMSLASTGTREPTPVDRRAESDATSTAQPTPITALGSPDEATPPAPGPVAPRAHEEPGQRRLRRGSR